MEGMIEKQTRMLREMQAASASPAEKGASQESDIPAVLPTVDQLNDYKASSERYAKEVQAIQEAIKQWSGGKQ
jgi:hypothetical protein